MRQNELLCVTNNCCLVIDDNYDDHKTSLNTIYTININPYLKQFSVGTTSRY